MIGLGVLQMALWLVVLLALARPLGEWMARGREGRPTALSRLLGPLERLCHRAAGVDPSAEMGWKPYALAMLAFNLLGFALVYACQRLQPLLPRSEEHTSELQSRFGI